MIPIVTPAEMAAVDAAAPEPVEVLIGRAASAVAWAARVLMGGTYGRRVVVVAGSGNNGADGRVAADRLRAWGARVQVIDAAEVDGADRLPPADLVIDAAFGTGLSRPYHAPLTRCPVLAVDIPSGVDGLTGEVLGRAFTADLTVTFQALKPGLVLPPGSAHVGEISVVDIGLEVGESHAQLLTASDAARLLPHPPVEAHKWRSACWVVGGSPGMTGAASLAAAAAARAGAGYVRLSTPGGAPDGPVEVVGRALPVHGWGRQLDDAARFGSVVVGPGLGRGDDVGTEVRSALATLDIPVVVDADGIAAVSADHDVTRERTAPTVLTPHDGEYETLMGHAPGVDRIEATRDAAAVTGAVVLLKGPTTVVADPGGDVAVVDDGDQRLATAGTGDVLAGVIGALLAQDMAPLEAAALGAWLHANAALAAPRRGMVASDLLTTLPEVLGATHMG